MDYRDRPGNDGVILIVESWLPYGFLLAIIFATIYFVVGQVQRRKDKAQESAEREYILPDYKAEYLESILSHIKQTFPSNSSGLMLCEFSDGKFDVAVGLHGTPIFVGSDYREIVKVIDLDHDVERKYIKIETKSGYFGLVVFDENDKPLNGRYKIAESVGIMGEKIGAFQVQENGVFGKVFIEVNEDSFRGMPTFDIKEKISFGASTTPVFLNEYEFLGFASYLVPSQYKSKLENGKTIRKLIQPSFSFGVIAKDLFKNNKLNFAFDVAKERTINNAKNK